ncbi:MAG: glycosyltransferase [Hymenobacter sp.]|nr:MAG: glycosyltransferase [Hymenobacter sp.]
MELVSVIIPSYNHGRYLQQRIDSVLAQSYVNFELIILDDKSKDNSREIIDLYKKNLRISHIILNEENSGSTFIQWEKGINLSSGKYIWIAESDDYSDINFLSDMVALLNAHPNCSLAFSQSRYVNEEGKVLSSGFEEVDDIWKQSIILNGEKALGQFIWHTQIVNASAVVFRKEYYARLETKDYMNFKLCGDWFFWISLLEHGGLIYNKNPLNYFRQHKSNARTSSFITNADILEPLIIYSYFVRKHSSVVGKYEINKVKFKFKYNLYVKICVFMKGEKIDNLGKALIKSFCQFPSLLPSLVALIFLKLISKITNVLKTKK